MAEVRPTHSATDVWVAMGDKERSTSPPDEREEGRQNVLEHESGEKDRRDSNETADEKVEIVEPDGSPSPRA